MLIYCCLLPMQRVTLLLLALQPLKLLRLRQYLKRLERQRLVLKALCLSLSKRLTITSAKLMAARPLNNQNIDKLLGQLVLVFRLEQKMPRQLNSLEIILHNKEHQMLQELTSKQVEEALMWLHSPLHLKPPQELRDLNPVEWYLLEQMLGQIWLEQASSPLH
jgi:hypothetical protein